MNLFNIFKPKKDIVLKCYTCRPEVFAYAKLERTAKFIPDWWRNLPKIDANDVAEFGRGNNMRGCVGFKNLYKHGIVIPMWSDLRITLSGKNDTEICDSYEYSDDCSSAVYHAPLQHGGHFDYQKCSHIKLVSPWLIECDEEVEFLMTDIPYNKNIEKFFDYSVLPGVLDFKYQQSCNINIVFYREQEKKSLLIPFGSPMCQIIPLTERKIKIETHLISQNEFREISDITKPISFVNKYYTIKKQIQKDEKQSKCPFHRKNK